MTFSAVDVMNIYKCKQLYSLSCFSIMSHLKLRKFFGKIRIASRKINPQILIISQIIARICVTQSNPTVCGFLQDIQFHTQRKDGVNTTCIWSLQRNFYHYKDALQKHKSRGLLTS